MLNQQRIFIHIPKNGGMTVRKHPKIARQTLFAHSQHHINPNYTYRLHEQMRKYGEHHGNEHARWRDWRKDFREKYRAFAIVRNPWARVVSRWKFAYTCMYEKESAIYGNEDYVNCKTFEDFLESRHEWKDVEFFWHRAIRGWYPAFDHVSDEEGKVRCDILRFENYDEDLNAYWGLIEPVRRRNVTGYDQSTYKQYYNEKTIQIVADWYKKDIDHWGFDFDTGATKNTFFKS